uniref:RING-type domain-containing protein n=1 Tax=Panagrolaimus davidi TaxID=227884 RepID=A0A914P694_9BILA
MSFLKSLFSNSDHTPGKGTSELEKIKLINLARCCICFENYSPKERAPICLPCGHTFCLVCVGTLTYGNLVCCCICRKVQLFGPHGLGKNIQLLDILESLGLVDADSKGNDKQESLSTFPENVLEAVDDQQLLMFFEFCFKFVKKYYERKHEALLDELANANADEGHNEDDLLDKAVHANQLLFARKLLCRSLDTALARFNECLQITKPQAQDDDFIEEYLAVMDEENDPFGIESAIRLNHG